LRGIQLRSIRHKEVNYTVYNLLFATVSTWLSYS